MQVKVDLCLGCGDGREGDCFCQLLCLIGNGIA